MKREDIDHLAELSRLSLTEDEKDEFLTEIDSVVSYVSDIQKAAGVLPDVPDIGVERAMLREDGDAHEKGVHTETLLKEANETDKKYVVVKKVLHQ